MHLVAGATGHLGSEICRRLRARGREVRALVRQTSDRSRVAALEAMGAETVVGDLRDRASLERACRGVETVISTANSMRSRQPGDSLESTDGRGQTNLVETAAAGGATHFVYVSVSGNLLGDDPLGAAKRRNEEVLRASGMSWTALRPSLFMEVWLSPPLGFDFPAARATIYGTGDQEISWISLGDVAEVAVLATELPAARDAVIELGGPEALSPHEVVRIFEEVSGRAFTLEHVPVTALAERKARAADPYEETFASLMLAMARGDEIPTSPILAAAGAPLEMLAVRDYAERVAGPAG